MIAAPGSEFNKVLLRGFPKVSPQPFANGSKSYSKERIEVYSNEQTWILDNFIITKAYDVKGFKTVKTKIDKGHRIQFHEFIIRIKKGGKPLISFNELVNVTKTSFMAIQSMKNNKWIDVI